MSAYLLIRTVTFPLSFLPYTAIHLLGNLFGLIAYYTVPKFRKRALSNLALATDLHLSAKQIPPLAKKAMQSLMITALEYAKLAREKEIHRIVTCDNPEVAAEIMKQGTAVIFFCAHQANWELLFLEGTSRMPGVAIGRPIKDKKLYAWVQGMRQKFGGKMIDRTDAIKEGLRALKKGVFLGIVGDQAMPESGFRCPFLGRMAWTSQMPALLSYRTGSPLFFAEVVRENHRYRIHYSDPIWPNSEGDKEAETERLMRKVLGLLEESIKRHPSQWLWIHNRWKQQTLDRIKRPFREECFLIILPKQMPEGLEIFREIYPLEFITLLMPRHAKTPPVEGAEILTYDTEEDLYLEDYRFKLVFDFTNNPKLRSHFLRLSAFHVITMHDLVKLAGIESDQLSVLLKKALCHAV